MKLSSQLDRLSADVFVWHHYDPKIKAELFATALRTAAGIVVFDPISLDFDQLRHEFDGAPVRAIVVTNENHLRASGEFADALNVPIFARTEAHAAFAPLVVKDFSETETLSDEISIIQIEGAAAGEIALHSAAGAGTLIIGDALINFGAHGFTLLPAKYCSNPKLMRKSLRQLLDYRFERILFAHGEPILTGGRERLAELLQ